MKRYRYQAVVVAAVEGVCGNMGLKNFSQQMAVINKLDTGVQYLKDYAKAINAMIDNINASWVGGQDKIALLNSMTQCIKKATQIANDYTVFIINAKRWLNDMNELEKISKPLVSNSSFTISIKEFSRNASTKLHIRIDELEGYATVINGYGKKIDLTCSNANSGKKSIDKLILQRLPKRYSHGSLESKLNELKSDNAAIVVNIKEICDKYRKVDNAIQDIANGLVVAGNSSGEINSSIKGVADVVDKIIGGGIPIGIDWKEEWENRKEKDASIKKKPTIPNSAIEEKSDIHKKIRGVLESIGIKSDTASKVVDIIMPTDIEHWLELGSDWSDGKYGEIWSDVSDIVMDIDYNVAYGEAGNVAIMILKGSVSKINVVTKTFAEGSKITINNVKEEGVVKGIINSIIPVGQQYAKASVDASVGMIKNTIESLPFVGEYVEKADKFLMTVTGENLSTGLDEISKNIESVFNYSCKQAQKGINKILNIDSVNSGIDKVEGWIKSKLVG